MLCVSYKFRIIYFFLIVSTTHPRPFKFNLAHINVSTFVIKKTGADFESKYYHVYFGRVRLHIQILYHVDFGRGRSYIITSVTLRSVCLAYFYVCHPSGYNNFTISEVPIMMNNSFLFFTTQLIHYSFRT